MGVSVAAQSVVAVRWAFRLHAATEVGVLVRLVRAATEVGVLVRSIPRQGPTRITVAKAGKEGDGKDDGKGGGGSMGGAGTGGIGGGMIGVRLATTSQEEDHEEDGGNR